MAFVGTRSYMVVVPHVGGSKAYDIMPILQGESRTGTTWFHAASILPNGEHVDAAVRELFEETSLILTPDDLNMLSSNPVRVS
jgi:8-oxo-dGTP pyrophosphatase MutT (NUDIX family)